MKTHNIEGIRKRFDEKFHGKYSIITFNDEVAEAIKSFISQEIKSLLKELKMKEKKHAYGMPDVERNFGYNQAVQELNQKINSLIK